MQLTPTKLIFISALILCLQTCRHKDAVPIAFLVDLAVAPESCGDSRNIVVVAIGENRARLNVEHDVTISEVARRLGEVMSYRAEKIVYIKAELGVSWGEFLELVSRVWPEVDIVSILTPKVEAAARRQGCMAPSCQNCTTARGLQRD